MNNVILPSLFNINFKYFFDFRRRRTFLKQNIKELLEKEGIKNAELIPKTSVNMRVEIKPGNNSPFPCFLPLETFDNTEYDCRTPEDWLELGSEGKKRKPVPGKALLPNGLFYLLLISYREISFIHLYQIRQ